MAQLDPRASPFRTPAAPVRGPSAGPVRRFPAGRRAPPQGLARLASLLLVAGLVVPAAVATAHGVAHQVERARAVTVTFTYPDGTPLAFADFQVHGPQDPRPAAAGLTDRAGRVVFLPDRPGAWTVHVTTVDGHGAEVTLDITADDLAAARPGRPASAEGADPAAVTDARWLRALLGVGLILVIALILSTVLRRARDGARTTR